MHRDAWLSRSGCVNALSGGVLSIGKLAAGQESYYVDAVAHGAEEYYLGAGEVPGYWIGTGVGQLGLDGAVSGDAFVALLNGYAWAGHVSNVVSSGRVATCASLGAVPARKWCVRRWNRRLRPLQLPGFAIVAE